MEIALKLYLLIRGPAANKILLLRRFDLFDALLSALVDSIDWPLYALEREILKDILLLNFIFREWSSRLLSEALRKTTQLETYFFISLILPVAETWITTPDYKIITEIILNHFLLI